MKNYFLPMLLAGACVAPAAGNEPMQLKSTQPQPTRSESMQHESMKHDAMHAKQSMTGSERSAAYQWVDIMLEASARDVELYGARPTILSRQMAIPVTAMYDAWAAYDDKAIGTRLGDELRQPRSERTLANMDQAIAYAAYRSLCDQYPDHVEYFASEMRKRGYNPYDNSMDTSTPQGVGNVAAKTLLEYRHHDGANQLGDEVGSNAKPYSDYTMYRPVNQVETAVVDPDGEFEINDPDRWAPIAFSNGKGGSFVPHFLTAHWYRVKPFALESSDQFRPGGPPKVGSEQMRREVEELVRLQAELVPEGKALVEFMRDGPRSTAQSGHWIKFAQEVSRRDNHDLEQDIKVFFSVGNVCMDAFIASWDAKRYYDSSRPYTLVHHYYKGQMIPGWGGPGKGIVQVRGEDWVPYSPANFPTPPFPGYTSGHSTVSAASGEILKLFTHSDLFEATTELTAGELTEPGFTCAQIQASEGKPHMHGPGEHCDVTLRMPTFTETADMAGISRVMGGYHIQTDNVDGLALGRQVARYSWPKYVAYFEGQVN